MPALCSSIHDIFDQALNQGNLAIIDELVSVDATAHMPGWGMPAGRLGLKQMFANLRAAFPDLHCTVENEIETESKSAALLTLRGTHHGSLLGNMPTGKRVEVQGTIFTISADGQIIENWLLIDQMSMLQQMGVVPPPRTLT